MDLEFRAAAGWSDRSLDEYRRFHCQHIANLPAGEVMLGITREDQLVGYVCFYLDGQASCELGIVVGPSNNWSHGYGRRAMELAILYAKAELNASRVWAETHPANIAAQRMLDAAGFVQSGGRGDVEQYRGHVATMIQYEISGFGRHPRLET